MKEDVHLADRSHFSFLFKDTYSRTEERMLDSRSLFTLLFHHFFPSLFVNLEGQGQPFTDREIFWCRHFGPHFSVIRSFLEFLVQKVRRITTSRVPRCSTKAARHSPHQKKNEIIIFKKILLNLSPSTFSLLLLTLFFFISKLV